MEYCESYPNKGGVPLLGFGKTRSMPQDMFRIGLGKVCAAVALKALFTRSLMALSVCFPGCELTISSLWIFEYCKLGKTQVESIIIIFPKVWRLSQSLKALHVCLHNLCCRKDKLLLMFLPMNMISK